MTELQPLDTWDSEATWRTFEEGAFRNWIGRVEIQKHQDDLDRYAELIEASQPDFVIETGTRRGGSALWFREQGLQVITIDIERTAGKEARKQEVDSGIGWWQGSSIDPEMTRHALERTRGARVMVSLDSDHHTTHVQTEIALWAPLVSPGCYLVVEDCCFDMWPGTRGATGGRLIPKVGGPLDAVRKMGLGQGLTCPEPLKRFWRDESLEGRTSISHSPCGWWRSHE